jgi:hypothetical protein
VLPELSGRPIRVEMRPSLGRMMAASHIPGRVVLLDVEVLKLRGDFERILIHEIFHFAWVRLPNASRRSWEKVLAAEIAAGAEGELGWSAEHRKLSLKASEISKRTAPWRRYACESFCDSAAWLFSEVRTHEEFTLKASHRRGRKAWFLANLPASAPIPI